MTAVMVKNWLFMVFFFFVVAGLRFLAGSRDKAIFAVESVAIDKGDELKVRPGEEALHIVEDVFLHFRFFLY